MALRIAPQAGGDTPLPMEQPEAVSEPAVMPEAAAPQQDLATQLTGGGTVSPELAHYVGPERMDMACQNCIHFMEPGSCEVVAGQIDPAGTCNLFTQDASNDEEAAEPVPDDESAEELSSGGTY